MNRSGGLFLRPSTWGVGAFFVVVLGCGTLLRFAQGIDVGEEHALYILYYLGLGCLFVWFTIKGLGIVHYRGWLGALFLCWKIPLGFALVYLLLTRYEGGDFGRYFHLPLAALKGIHAYHWDEVKGDGTNLASCMIFLIFNVLPVSLYGLSIVFGTMSFCAFLVIYRIFEERVASPGALLFALFLLPSISLQSSYVGKDGFVLVLTAVLIFWLDRYFRGKNRAKCLFWIGFCLAGIWMFRNYQSLLVLVALYFTVMARLSLIGRLIMIFLGVLLFLAAWREDVLRMVIWTLDEGPVSMTSLINAIEVVYSGGSLMLRPLPFPLQLFQVFRPFPWEANNLLSALSGVENAAVLCFCLWFLIVDWREVFRRIRKDPRLTFLTAYSAVFIMAFSFSSNMGDLSRRRIYFISLLLICFLRASTFQNGKISAKRGLDARDE
ncbi:MAG: hypothetical protein PHV34_03460 [Verrucomicrobiae bacterium]|nr:hypothetical protein [Verrucomicrobiae bacterium]